MSRTTGLRFHSLLLLIVLAWPAARADSPRMALIMDDLGDRPALDFQLADFPVTLTCAILPHTPHAQRIARRCEASGKDIMLHLPLQAESYNELLGPGRLKMDMDEAAFRESFRHSLASVPGTIGVNNHMGSLLTRHPGAMTWLMEELNEAGLFFVDSRTTAASVAMDMAREQAVPATARDVFLDAERDPEQIEAELDRAVRIAHARGSVVVIGHPYPETMEVLQRRLPWLELESGVRLSPVRDLIRSPTVEQDDKEAGRHEQARTGTTGGGL